MCASSTMYTLYEVSPDGAYIARSRSSRASSTPRFDAASISTTSRLAAPLQMRRHDAHSPHGSPSRERSPRRSQLSAIASTRASVVLPTPRGPQRRYPCATLPRAIAPFSVVETCDCTATSANRLGRYLRARARAIRMGQEGTGIYNSVRSSEQRVFCARWPVLRSEFSYSLSVVGG